MQMTVAQALARGMKAYGAEYVFTLTGAPQDPLIQMQNREGIRVVLARSERSAFCMADAYARLTGKPTFGVVQFGPGATYLPPSLIDAFWANSPLIAISASASTRMRHRLDYQEVDQLPMFAPFTKWSGELPAPDRIVDLLSTAVRAAVSGVPGPVYLGIPYDFFDVLLGEQQRIACDESLLEVPARRVSPGASEIEAALTLLAEAERPVLFAGGGILLSKAWEELTRFAEKLSLPVVTSLAGKGSIADTHPLAVGVAGRYSRKVANDVLGMCDICLVIGSRLGSLATDGFKYPRPESRIIHVDLDAMTLGCNYREEISIVGDARTALRMLLEAVEDGPFSGRPLRWQAWTEEVRGKVAEWRATFRELARNPLHDGRLDPRFVMQTLDAYVEGDDIVVADTGYMASWASTLIDQKVPGRSSLRAAGSLGWAFPGALGAKLAVGDKRRVVCLIGDGGLGYHLADLETALRWKLPVVTVVMNNASLAFEYHVQKYIHKELCPEASDFLDIDFAAVARAFGAHGERVSEPDALAPALRRAEASGKPAVVDVAISREVYPPTTRYETVHAREL